MKLARWIFAGLVLGLSAQTALACTEREPATVQPQASGRMFELAQSVANGSIGEERPGCECPYPAGVSANVNCESDKVLQLTGAIACARPWTVVQPLAPARRVGAADSVASPPALPRYLIFARLIR